MAILMFSGNAVIPSHPAQTIAVGIPHMVTNNKRHAQAIFIIKFLKVGRVHRMRHQVRFLSVAVQDE